MMSKSRLLFAAPVLVGLIAAPTLAHADWQRGGGSHGGNGGWHGGNPGWHGGNPGWHGGGWGYHPYYRPGFPAGAVVAGAIVGLGAAAVAGSLLAPPVYYAPPPVYYAPPPVYYAPPPVVYQAPGYVAPAY